jgi:predicted DNA-binding antitoxin AbrB/MazE fold protein
MTHSVEGTYQQGVLKLDSPVPLEEGQKVRVVVYTRPSRARQTQGMLGWNGDEETAEYFARNSDLELGEEDA